MRSRRLTGLVQVALLAMTTAVFAQAGSGSSDPEAIQLKMSKETGYYTFQETVGRVTVVVGGQLAGQEETRRYVPFQVAVAVAGKGPELDMSRLNFELHDAYGEDHETVDAQKVQEGINSFVRQWVQANPLNLGSQFETYQRVASDFYPSTQGGITHQTLDREEYLVDVVYFPRPKDLHGELMLSFFAEGMKEGAINVRFKALQGKEKKIK
jgi:hypothetical protein